MRICVLIPPCFDSRGIYHFLFQGVRDMCESYGSTRSMSLKLKAGRERERQLLQWANEDGEFPDLPPNCHIKWRDEVTRRLPPFRPIKCRMPAIIARLLLEFGMIGEDFLLHRCVTIDPDGSVWERKHRKGKPDERGKRLIASLEFE